MYKSLLGLDLNDMDGYTEKKAPKFELVFSMWYVVYFLKEMPFMHYNFHSPLKAPENRPLLYLWQALGTRWETWLWTWVMIVTRK